MKCPVCGDNLFVRATRAADATDYKFVRQALADVGKLAELVRYVRLLSCPLGHKQVTVEIVTTTEA